MAEENDNNKVNQPKLNETLKPSENVKDWNNHQPRNPDLAAAKKKAQEQVDADPSIKKGMSQVKSQEMDR
jgi:hypothetical protein